MANKTKATPQKQEAWEKGPATPDAPDASTIPAADAAGRPTLRRGDTGNLVRQIQNKVRTAETGTFDAITEAEVRQYQRDHNLVPDGIIGPRTWAALLD
jgi:peptidoglycan hydrolase-like protein with peptidoglycan-binding domain